MAEICWWITPRARARRGISAAPAPHSRLDESSDSGYRRITAACWAIDGASREVWRKAAPRPAQNRRIAFIFGRPDCRRSRGTCSGFRKAHGQNAKWQDGEGPGSIPKLGRSRDARRGWQQLERIFREATRSRLRPSAKPFCKRACQGGHSPLRGCPPPPLLANRVCREISYPRPRPVSLAAAKRGHNNRRSRSIR